MAKPALGLCGVHPSSCSWATAFRMDLPYFAKSAPLASVAEGGVLVASALGMSMLRVNGFTCTPCGLFSLVPALAPTLMIAMPADPNASVSGGVMSAPRIPSASPGRMPVSCWGMSKAPRRASPFMPMRMAATGRMAGPDIPAQLRVLALASEGVALDVSPLDQRMAALEEALKALPAPAAA